MDLFTIGFTKKGARVFFGMLSEARVRVLLDIRAHPGSQLAGFAKAGDLAYFLEALCGIEYRQLPLLAPEAALLADYRKGGVNWPEYETRYLENLDAIQALRSTPIGQFDRACLLCAEPRPDQCHRRLAAEYIAARHAGLIVRHLI